jgi:hypothetical protein
VTAEAAFAVHNVQRLHGKVLAVDDPFSTLWAESAIALVTGRIAQVHVP